MNEYVRQYCSIVISLKTSSALIGGNCTTWPCNNFACYTVAWYTFRMLHSYLVYISNVTQLPGIHLECYTPALIALLLPFIYQTSTLYQASTLYKTSTL